MDTIGIQCWSFIHRNEIVPDRFAKVVSESQRVHFLAKNVYGMSREGFCASIILIDSESCDGYAACKVCN